MSENYLFFVNEGSDRLMLVMTYPAMKNLQRMIESVDRQWKESDDFAYLALSGGISQKVIAAEERKEQP